MGYSLKLIAYLHVNISRKEFCKGNNFARDLGSPSMSPLPEPSMATKKATFGMS